MPERDRATVRIHPRIIVWNAELTKTRERLCSERLIQLDHVHLIDRQSGNRDAAQHDQDALKANREQVKQDQDRIKQINSGRGREGRGAREGRGGREGRTGGEGRGRTGGGGRGRGAV